MTAGNRPEYEKRVNRVIDHIRDHLADELTLADLARVAAFSPFHFHRVSVEGKPDAFRCELCMPLRPL